MRKNKLYFILPFLVIPLCGFMKFGFSSATDSATRANNASIGAAWTDLDTACTIASNQFSVTGTDVDAIEKWAATTFSKNQSSQIQLGTGSTAARSTWNAMVRITDGSNFYAFDISNVDNTYTIYKLVTGTPTTLKTGAHTPAAGEVIRLEVLGTSLVGKINGVVIDSVTDSSLTTGQPGFDLSATGTGTCTGVNWQGTSL